VIEVTAAGSQAVTSQGHVVRRVIVRVGTRRRRHVVLLLRLHDGTTTTHISTEGLRGTLDIVVSTVKIGGVWVYLLFIIYCYFSLIF